MISLPIRRCGRPAHRLRGNLAHATTDSWRRGGAPSDRFSATSSEVRASRSSDRPSGAGAGRPCDRGNCVRPGLPAPREAGPLPLAARDRLRVTIGSDNPPDAMTNETYPATRRPTATSALICLLVMLAATHARAFDLQGHRGARGLAPENTLAAFAKALKIGVTTLETDLAVTKDG